MTDFMKPEFKLNEVQRICNKFIEVWRSYDGNDSNINYDRVWGAAIAAETILSILDCSYNNLSEQEEMV